MLSFKDKILNLNNKKSKILYYNDQNVKMNIL